MQRIFDKKYILLGESVWKKKYISDLILDKF